MFRLCVYAAIAHIHRIMWKYGLYIEVEPFVLCKALVFIRYKVIWYVLYRDLYFRSLWLSAQWYEFNMGADDERCSYWCLSTTTGGATRRRYAQEYCRDEYHWFQQNLYRILIVCLSLVWFKLEVGVHWGKRHSINLFISPIPMCLFFSVKTVTNKYVK